MDGCCDRNCRTRKLVELNDAGARAVAGLVAVVRDGSFAGVVCESEHSAEAALKALRKGTTWSGVKRYPMRTTSRLS